MMRGVDTVVLSQVCDIDKTVSAAFQQALPAWVAAGHKLVIHDSDMCGGRRTKAPDYRFLPYPFATSNPGALGAPGRALDLVEDSALAHGSPSHPGYVDIERWKKSASGFDCSAVEPGFVTSSVVRPPPSSPMVRWIQRRSRGLMAPKV